MRTSAKSKVLATLAVGAIVLSVVVGGLPRTPVADAATPAAWVGAPLAGTWPNSAGCPDSFPSAACSLPASHHTYFNGMPYRGDVGWDQQSVRAGAAVKLYVAPQNGEHITTKVEKVRPACGRRSGESQASQLARGGHVVVVGVYTGGSRIGWVTYTHVNPRVQEGQAVNRWGTTIGTVGSYRSNSCWQGVHLHMELTNQRSYACYNRGWRPGQRMEATNFVGFVGGSYASGPRRACP